jgi:hypothetical protein
MLIARGYPIDFDNQLDAIDCLINTEIKPFKATAYHNGKFVQCPTLT